MGIRVKFQVNIEAPNELGHASAAVAILYRVLQLGGRRVDVDGPITSGSLVVEVPERYRDELVMLDQVLDSLSEYGPRIWTRVDVVAACAECGSLDVVDTLTNELLCGECFDYFRGLGVDEFRAGVIYALESMREIYGAGVMQSDVWQEYMGVEA